jgi:hypothetical protein
MFSSGRCLRNAGWTLTAIFCFAASAFAQKPMMAVDKNLPLSAEQTAQAIGILPLFARIKELTASPLGSSPAELAVLQQQVLMRVTAASLQIEAATGEIDSEIADTRELENYLISHRNTRRNSIDLLSLAIGGTLGSASSALGFTVHDTASSVTGLVAGTTTVALSLWELRVRRGEVRTLEAPSNMLSEIFDRPSDTNDMYPPVVITFMHAIPPDDKDGLSRQERLIHNWIKVGRISPPDSPRGREKIDHVTSLPSQDIKQSIEDLDDRQAMLYDLRVRFKYIQQDLASLLTSIPAVSMTP